MIILRTENVPRIIRILLLKREFLESSKMDVNNP
jgi:hypothetical protein